ncbi:MAG: hypothetical protein J6T35_08515, partial [Bacteroidales bacterium]|nr:hypothetical protein [Bacteroidales bacterium]
MRRKRKIYEFLRADCHWRRGCRTDGGLCFGENGTQRLDDSLVKEQFAKDYSKIDVLYYPYYDKDAETGDST